MVAISSATSTRQASITTSCVALAKAASPASRLKMPIVSLLGAMQLSESSAAPITTCAVTIHCLRLPSFLSPGISTRSSAGLHRNLKA